MARSQPEHRLRGLLGGVVDDPYGLPGDRSTMAAISGYVGALWPVSTYVPPSWPSPVRTAATAAAMSATSTALTPAVPMPASSPATCVTWSGSVRT
ncbi:hypothetical protein ETD86_03105 [Nonomuraea turkmeniaca]|uniref:Uncharacterized protein n=1 Tax=Nonomuraea turkmeniaca TaxID=103838 RepID=A0A5S4FVV1_9ACTN|nr:hypothetical protein [Nonomuraea turkmeniaca]TMR24927.1 hypothetical protein ETD86_03105 [Nonomuraea turkmeniaca]